MSTVNKSGNNGGTSNPTEIDAVVIGAGFAGLGMLHALRGLGLTTRVVDAGSDLGGTWHWNCYPGARTDSESYYYCFSFSKELLEDWSWSERYPSQPEVERYLDHVADRFDLRRDIQFNTWVVSAHYDEATNRWLIKTDQGGTISAQYLISAMGIISAPNIPNFKGLDSFQGECYHTARWPREGVDLAGKRVGVIGAGASAIQLVPEAAETAAQVTLFQRTPNYIFPARNKPMDAQREREIKDNYDEIWEKSRNHSFSMPFDSPANRLASETSPEEREKIYEELWQAGSFRFFFESFDDLLTDEDSNDTAAEFLRNKIRTLVKDQDVAESLVPDTYPLFAKRPPADHGYYETFNRDNVTLVDIANKESFAEITESGVRTSAGEYEFDVLVLATGFDAVTGALTRVDIRGRDDVSLKQKWQEGGPSTYLGLSNHGFPNLFMITGPQAPFANIPVLIEDNINWITDCIDHMQQRGYTAVEADEAAEKAWTKHCKEVLDYTVMRRGGDVSSWFMGTNIEGKPTGILVYFGGGDAYINKCAEVKEGGFEGMLFSGESRARPDTSDSAASRA